MNLANSNTTVHRRRKVARARRCSRDCNSPLALIIALVHNGLPGIALNTHRLFLHCFPPCHMAYHLSLIRHALPPLMPARINLRNILAAHAGYHSRQALLRATSSAVAARRAVSLADAYAPRLGCVAFSTRSSKTSHVPMRRSNMIVFKGLHPDFSEDEVEGFFSQFGKVRWVHVRRFTHKEEAASGYVEFVLQESVDKALALDGEEVLKRPMVIHDLYYIPDTISLGCLPLGVDENQVKALFSSCGEVIDIKIHTSVTSQETGLCYGFVRFASPTSVWTACKLKQPMVAGQRLYVSRARQRAEDFSIWDEYDESSEVTAQSVNVYGIPPQVTEDQLKAAFEHCGEIVLARIWRVLATGNSLGFGFIRFASAEPVEKALAVSLTIAGQHLRMSRPAPLRPRVLDISPLKSIPRNTVQEKSVFVGRLSSDVDDDRLRREFERFGKIVKALVRREPRSGKTRGFGYVKFASPDSVELALQHDNILKIDGNSVKITPDRSHGMLGSPARAGRPASNANDPLYSDSHHSSGSWEYDY